MIFPLGPDSSCLVAASSLKSSSFFHLPIWLITTSQESWVSWIYLYLSLSLFVSAILVSYLTFNSMGAILALWGNILFLKQDNLGSCWSQAYILSCWGKMGSQHSTLIVLYFSLIRVSPLNALIQECSFQSVANTQRCLPAVLVLQASQIAGRHWGWLKTPWVVFFFFT